MWRHLLALTDEAAADGRPVFEPFVETSAWNDGSGPDVVRPTGGY